MERVSFSDGLAIGGGILSILLVVFDKAGKLKGRLLYVLLAFAVAMALPLCFSLPWVANSPTASVMSFRRALLVSLLVIAWAILCAWTRSTEVPALPNRLTVQSILPGILQIGFPFTATVFIKNNSGKIIRTRNVAITQTRHNPLNAAEELENENAM